MSINAPELYTPSLLLAHGGEVVLQEFVDEAIVQYLGVVLSNTKTIVPSPLPVTTNAAPVATIIAFVMTNTAFVVTNLRLVVVTVAPVVTNIALVVITIAMFSVKLRNQP